MTRTSYNRQFPTKIKTVALIMTFAALDCGVCNPVAASNYTDGVKSYTSGRYADAVRLLSASVASAEGSGPYADQIHYYLGLSYQGLNQRSSAANEFRWVLNKSKNQALRSYADVGYQRFASSSAAPGSSQPATGATTSGQGKAAAATTTITTTTTKTIVSEAPRGGYLPRNSNEFFVEPGSGGTMDCGPTALVTIFKAFKKYPKNFPHDDAGMVASTRLLMTGKSVQDYTTVDQMMNVFTANGFRTERFDGKDRMDYWVMHGVPVVSLGPPYGPNGYGKRLDPELEKKWKADTGHYFVITGLQNGIYSVNDPMSPTPHTLTTAEMTSWINGDGFNGRYKMRNIAVSP